MIEKETGGPAFPTEEWSASGEPQHSSGMDLRTYAAIKLKVPDSGIDWLDAMIERSRRDNVAALAMQGFLSNSDGGWVNGPMDKLECIDWTLAAHQLADAMRKESK